MESSSIEYNAKAASPLVNGDAVLKITDKGLMLTTTFDTAEVPFCDMNELSLANYVITLKADSGDYVFSMMGNWCQPFHDALSEAYNKAVLRSLFVKGAPIVTAKGYYSFSDVSGIAAGDAPVHVYGNCIVTLPPDLNAKRVPLCFARGLDKGDFQMTLTLDTGEKYLWGRLGYETAPFTEAVEKQIRALREKTLAAVKEIDPTIDTAQASKLANLVPQGAAASLGQLAAISPSFATALENKIADTRAAETYKYFKSICDPSKLYIGFRKNADAEEGDTEGNTEGTVLSVPTNQGDGPFDRQEAGVVQMDGFAAPEFEEVADETPDPYLLWLIAPSPDGQYAAVEFAEPNSATFVYRTGGDFDGFAGKLNKALEAIDFKREVIRLTDDELRKPENADYYMAAKRTAALGFIRANFKGRAIHSNPDAWKRKVNELWGS